MDSDIAKSTKPRKKNKSKENSIKSNLDKNNDIESDDEGSDKMNDTESLKTTSVDVYIEQKIIDEAETKAKEALLNSCSSSSDGEVYAIQTIVSQVIMYKSKTHSFHDLFLLISKNTFIKCCNI